MNSAENITAKKLTDLGVTQPEQVAPLFAQVRSRFDADSAQVRDEPPGNFSATPGSAANPAFSPRSPTIG